MNRSTSRARRFRRIAFVATSVLVVAMVSSVVGSTRRAHAETEVHLTAAGDYGGRAATDAVLRKIADLAPDAHLALGDFEYSDVSPESAWCSYVKARVGEGFPFELISGNHESLDIADGLINNFSACLPNQIPGIAGTYGREYYMDLPSSAAPLVRVIQTSPNLTFEDGKWVYAAGDAHYTWLANAIDDGRAKGAKWIIVTAHEPCLSVGGIECPTGSAAFFNLLLTKRVDLVLHGHEHEYMRTHQLRNGVTGCPTLTIGTFNPACVADNDGAFYSGQGTVFATAGTGGINLQSVDAADSEAPYFAAFEGSNSNPTYGLLDLHLSDTQLTAQFAGTSGGNFTDAFTITKGTPPPNQPPVASFTSQVQGLTARFNGLASIDDDGPIASYAWDFGDGSSANGVTASHTYATAGQYTVTLTVTDGDGMTDDAVQTVTATNPPPFFAFDAFGRTVSGGLGVADVGGTWTVGGSANNFAVNGGQARVTLPTTGAGRTASLATASALDTDLRMDVSVDKVPTGNGAMAMMTAIARSVGNADYRLRLRVAATGSDLLLMRVQNSVATTLSTVSLPGLSYTAGAVVHMRFQATGAAPTTLTGKVWIGAAAEPAGWQITATDATATLQKAGGVGIHEGLAGTTTNLPIVVSIDNYVGAKP